MEAAVYEELDEVKAQLEQVRDEFRKKTLLHQELGRAYDDRLTEFQEAKLQIEKLSEEVCVKSAEVSEVRSICEELKSSVSDKDLILRQLKSANEKLRAGFEEKVVLLEGSKRELVMALEDVTEKKNLLEDKFCAKNEENEVLKASLLATERKCLEMEKTVRLSKELSSRDELMARLEEELRNVQDRLKWRNEQFDHLEEAHDKLHGEFRLSKTEWEKERCVLVDQISSLQSSLESQTRISSSLQTELNMCNQALAREESRRKLFQVQLTEPRELFKNVNGKCLEEQVEIDRINILKDDEIANFRGQMAKKDIMFKEMEFKIRELEQQKEDMHVSLRELQEAGIKHACNITSMKKLQKKLRNLEVMHNNFSVNGEKKEAKWASHCERLKAEVNKHLTEIENKEAQVNELHKELEMCQLSLQILNEEMEVIMMVLKSEYCEAYWKLHFEYENKKYEESVPVLESNVTDPVEQHHSLLLQNDMEFHKSVTEESQRKQRQLEEHIFEIEQSNKAELEILKEEMSVVTMVLKLGYSEAYSKLLNEYENTKYEESTAPVPDSNVTNLVEQHQIHLLARDLEFELYKNMVKESQRKQRQLEEHILELERAYKAEWVEKAHERSLLNAELKEWKNEGAALRLLLEEAQQTNQQIESLLDLQLENQQTTEQQMYNLKNEVKDHERNISALQQHVTSLEAAMTVKDNALKLLESKNKQADSIIKELEFKNMKLNENVSSLVMHRNDILFEMEGLCNQIHEIWCKDETLLGSFGNTEVHRTDYVSNSL